MPPWKDDNSKWWNCDDCYLASATLTEYDSNPGVYVLTLTCPDSEIVPITPEEPIADLDTLKGELGGYCREYCENVFV